MITVTLPIRTVSEANQRGHWAKGAKRKAEHRALTELALRHPLMDLGVVAVYRPLGQPCVVTLTRTAPRALDDDNLCSALKATRDGVADALGVNDRDPRVTWRYAQERGAPKQYAVRVTIEPGGA